MDTLHSESHAAFIGWSIAFTVILWVAIYAFYWYIKRVKVKQRQRDSTTEDEVSNEAGTPKPALRSKTTSTATTTSITINADDRRSPTTPSISLHPEPSLRRPSRALTGRVTQSFEGRGRARSSSSVNRTPPSPRPGTPAPPYPAESPSSSAKGSYGTLPSQQKISIQLPAESKSAGRG